MHTVECLQLLRRTRTQTPQETTLKEGLLRLQSQLLRKYEVLEL